MQPGRATAIAGWVTLALIAAMGLGGAAARPGGLLLGLPSFPALAGVAMLVVLGWRAHVDARASTGLLVIPLLLLSGAPIPGLSALSGPPLGALALAGIALALAVARPPWEARFFFPLVLGLYLLAAARVQAQVGPEGDEPHYLMVAESLLRDHDLSLEPDYAEGRYRAFHPGDLTPHYRVRGRHGEIYSLHAVGLSLLLLPAYAVGGYAAASFFMAVLAALLAREIRLLVRAWTADPMLAAGVGWTVALSPPLVHYAGLLFTEVPAALAVAVALRREPSTVRAALAMGVAAALLPWLNVRYAPLAAILILQALATGPRKRSAMALVGPAAVSLLLLALYHFHLYGFFDPRRVYGRRPEISLGGAPGGLAGLLLDQEFGLLVYAPVFALALAGLPALRQHGGRRAVVALSLVLVTLLSAASWPMWRGGWNPPARFLLPIVPVLALGLAAALRRGLGASAALLVGWSVWTGLLGAAEPRLVHRDRDGNAPLFRAFSGAEEWTRLLPGYVRPEALPERDRLAVLWSATLALAVVASLRRRRETSPVMVAAAALTVLAAAGVASRVATTRTGGRDAVRVVGRPAVVVPGWEAIARAAARWRTDALDWGPLYEPHRHPEGAVLGDRLPLPPGAYRLVLEGESPPGPVVPGVLELGLEGRSPGRRQLTMETVPRGWGASFSVEPGVRAVTASVRGGSALIVREIALERLNR